jgi:hypothetical protein
MTLIEVAYPRRDSMTFSLPSPNFADGLRRASLRLTAAALYWLHHHALRSE